MRSTASFSQLRIYQIYSANTQTIEQAEIFLIFSANAQTFEQAHVVTFQYPSAPTFPGKHAGLGLPGSILENVGSSSVTAGNRTDIRTRRQQRQDPARVHHLLRPGRALPVTAAQRALPQIPERNLDVLHAGLHPDCHLPQCHEWY